MSSVSHDQAQAYYEDFSLAVGERDWIVPNLRHQQLKLVVKDVLDGRRHLRIADVGCGAGVMTDFLTRFGEVVGVDFSTAAIAAARRYASGATFREGGVEALPAERYDLITLFDVLEHIPADKRPEFIGQLRERVADDGLILLSTPFPSATRSKRAAGTALQIIDEEVELPAIIAEAEATGLQLIRFEAYDVFAGSPEYQVMVFAPMRSFGGRPALQPRRLRRRRLVYGVKIVQLARRVTLALRCVKRGDLATAAWFMRGRYDDVLS